MGPERFQMAKRYRPAQRGGGGPVHDGWTITDALTGATIVGDTKLEAQARANRRVDLEDQVRKIPAGLVTGFWRGEQTRSHLPYAEVWLELNGSGRHDVKVGMVAHSPDVEAYTAALLAHVGHSDLPRLGAP